MTEETVRVPPLSALRALEAVARLKGVSAAARELRISHPAISQALSRLEAELGEPLFSRTGSGPAPTEIARELIGAYNELVARLRRIYRNQTPSLLRLRVAAPPVLAHFWFPHIDAAAGHGVEFNVLQDGADALGAEIFDVSVVRVAGPNHSGLSHIAPECLAIAVPTTQGDLAPQNRPVLYTASIWRPFLTEEMLTRFGLGKATRSVIQEPGVCLALAEAHGAACLFDEKVLRLPRRQKVWRVLEGSSLFTGYSYAIRAANDVTRSPAAQPVLNAWLEWIRRPEALLESDEPIRSAKS